MVNAGNVDVKDRPVKVAFYSVVDKREKKKIEDRVTLGTGKSVSRSGQLDTTGMRDEERNRGRRRVPHKGRNGPGDRLGEREGLFVQEGKGLLLVGIERVRAVRRRSLRRRRHLMPARRFRRNQDRCESRQGSLTVGRRRS